MINKELKNNTSRLKLASHFGFGYVGEAAERFIEKTKDIKEMNVFLCEFIRSSFEAEVDFQLNQKIAFVKNMLSINPNYYTKVLLKEFVKINKLQFDIELNFESIDFNQGAMLLNDLKDIYYFVDAKKGSNANFSIEDGDKIMDSIRDDIFKVAMNMEKISLTDNESFFEAARSIDKVYFIYDDLKPKVRETSREFVKYAKNLRNMITREWSTINYNYLNLSYKDAAFIKFYILYYKDSEKNYHPDIKITPKGIFRSVVEFFISIIEDESWDLKIPENITNSIEYSMCNKDYKDYDSIRKLSMNLYKAKSSEVLSKILRLFYYEFSVTSNIIYKEDCLNLYKNKEIVCPAFKQFSSCDYEDVIENASIDYDNIVSTPGLFEDLQRYFVKYKHSSYSYRYNYKGKCFDNYFRYLAENDMIDIFNYSFKNTNNTKDLFEVFMKNVYGYLKEKNRIKDMLKFLKVYIKYDSLNYIVKKDIINDMMSQPNKKELMDMYLDILESYSLCDFLDFIVIGINENNRYLKIKLVDLKELYSCSDEDVDAINLKIADIFYKHKFRTSVVKIHLAINNNILAEEDYLKMCADYADGHKKKADSEENVIYYELVKREGAKDVIKDQKDKNNIENIYGSYDFERFCRASDFKLSKENKRLFIEVLKTVSKTYVAESFFLCSIKSDDKEFVEEVRKVVEDKFREEYSVC